MGPNQTTFVTNDCCEPQKSRFTQVTTHDKQLISKVLIRSSAACHILPFAVVKGTPHIDKTRLEKIRKRYRTPTRSGPADKLAFFWIPDCLFELVASLRASFLLILIVVARHLVYRVSTSITVLPRTPPAHLWPARQPPNDRKRCAKRGKKMHSTLVIFNDVSDL